MSFFELASLMPVWAVFAAVVAFVLGCCMGSFINCMAWRIVVGESWTSGRSHCATCNHDLAPLDLVPVVSWLALGGKCRYCGERISARYMAAELVCGLWFLSMLAAYGFTVQAACLMVLGCLLLGLSLVDLDSMIIPNGYIIAGIVLWVVMVAAQVAAGQLGSGAYGSLGTLWGGIAGGDVLTACLADGIGGALVISVLVLLVAVVFGKVAGKQGMGMGDVKLYFVVTLYLGLACGFLNLFSSCVIGLVFALVAGKKRQFPFGPSIAVATWITLLVGPHLVAAYLVLFGL